MFEDFHIRRQDSQSFSNKISACAAERVGGEVKLWFHLPLAFSSNFSIQRGKIQYEYSH
jgi:hypothetical protein